jgi:hypothetical protein
MTDNVVPYVATVISALNALASGLGIIGSLMLAKPFVDRQQMQNDATILANIMTSDDEEINELIATSKDEIIRTLCKHVDRDYAVGWWGAIVLLAAFVLLLASSSLELWRTLA